MPAELLGENVSSWVMLGKVLWIMLFGMWLSLIASIIGLCYCCTIIGIPWGVACFRIADVSFAPMGKRIVQKDLAQEVKRRYVEKMFDGR